ncbi:uncharacterized protein MONBRDRAFT_34299 [Monosiga brevicollis MX1]|uniref:Uncharacterized protein n=1 Tax=Monosiga brevicollis TaxID=81824 RepID=A9VAT4_MONBE|nr:uncharacterized protein MONBRDRAFT_34299 [Monosiga brevicollis MX1]EDQ85376.1 predicted protein [Monosiga brevicollis MX1]|eukprot:XP_001749787.1 hypothetical protein [Monosiga brevicollis MX1]
MCPLTDMCVSLSDCQHVAMRLRYHDDFKWAAGSDESYRSHYLNNVYHNSNDTRFNNDPLHYNDVCSKRFLYNSNGAHFKNAALHYNDVCSKQFIYNNNGVRFNNDAFHYNDVCPNNDVCSYQCHHNLKHEHYHKSDGHFSQCHHHDAFRYNSSNDSQCQHDSHDVCFYQCHHHSHDVCCYQCHHHSHDVCFNQCHHDNRHKRYHNNVINDNNNDNNDAGAHKRTGESQEQQTSAHRHHLGRVFRCFYRHVYYCGLRMAPASSTPRPPCRAPDGARL